MKNETQISASKRNGNLHIQVEGQVTPKSMAQVTIIMAKMSRGSGNIFIHTHRVTNIAPKSSNAFNKLIQLSGLRRDNIFLTGKKGIDFCCDRNRVIRSA